MFLFNKKRKKQSAICFYRLCNQRLVFEAIRWLFFSTLSALQNGASESRPHESLCSTAIAALRLDAAFLRQWRYGAPLCRYTANMQTYLEPHLGHLYTSVLADAHFRWNRLKNGHTIEEKASEGAVEARKGVQSDDCFVVGTDEHGMKVQRAAQRANQTPHDFCDFYSRRFRELFHSFDVGYTQFVRTSDKAHVEAVEAFWVRNFCSCFLSFYCFSLFRNVSNRVGIFIKAHTKAGIRFETSLFIAATMLKRRLRVASDLWCAFLQC